LGVAEWYYIADKRQLGPVSFERLEELADAGKLRASDLVWREGMSTWERAGKQGLFKAGDAATGDVQPFHDRASPDPRRRQPRHDGMPVGEKVGLSFGAGVALLIVAGISSYFLMRSDGAFDIAAAGNVIPGVLEHDAPPDAVRGTPCRVHAVRLLRGHTYHIDLQSNQPGFMVRLESGDFSRLREAENDGEGGRAHLVFRCPRSGTYRVIVTSQFPGQYTLFVGQP
jgi:hypothetical protein